MLANEIVSLSVRQPCELAAGRWQLENWQVRQRPHPRSTRTNKARTRWLRQLLPDYLGRSRLKITQENSNKVGKVGLVGVCNPVLPYVGEVGRPARWHTPSSTTLVGRKVLNAQPVVRADVDASARRPHPHNPHCHIRTSTP